jgi:soluble cytochrome b562
VVTYVGKYPVRGLNEIPYYPSSPWDPEPPQWWEEEVPPKPPPSIPYALVPLNLDYIWAWIERWNRRLAIVWAETLLMPADWDEYERRWRQQWELDSLDDLERGVEDVIANLERQIWVLEQELDLNRVLTRVDDTNEYRGGPQFKAEEIDGIKKELEEAKKKLDEWKQAQEELRRIRREIEQRNLRSGGPKPL